jgi:hypothetical protein
MKFLGAFFLALLVLIPLRNVNIVFASSEHWVEVKRFTGVGGISTIPTFTVDHVDWRIRWEIEPGNGSERTAFLVYVYPATGGQWFEQIQHFGREETTGILNICNYSGSFYLNVLTGTVNGYTIIVEQNIDSIPEFPSWIILPTFLIVTFLAITFRKRPSVNSLDN